jgi:phosphate transport system protein
VSSDHIVKQFDVDLRILKDKLLLMASVVEDHIAKAIRALDERDVELAQEVVQGDRQVNVLEIETDELCLRILALRQPAASDLRFISASLKIVVDLERVGDLAVNMAERAEALAKSPQLLPTLDLTRMAAATQAMLKDSLDAFVRADPELATSVLVRDQEVDELFVEAFRYLVDAMKHDPNNVERALGLMFVAKHLERIADHSTNIAEMVVFLAQGKDVRHRFSIDERDRRSESQ